MMTPLVRAQWLGGPDDGAEVDLPGDADGNPTMQYIMFARLPKEPDEENPPTMDEVLDSALDKWRCPIVRTVNGWRIIWPKGA